MSIVKPLGSNVLLEPIEDTESSGGIALPLNTSNSFLPKAKVIDVGSNLLNLQEYQTIHVGHTVVYEPETARKVNSGESTLLLIDESYILAVAVVG